MDIRTLDKVETIKPLLKTTYDLVETNLISDLGYKSFQERTKSLIEGLENSIIDKYSKALGINCYDLYKATGKYFKYNKEEEKMAKGLKYMGVYKFSNLSDYIGEIPEKNQREIKTKLDILKSHSFIKVLGWDFKLMVLAPLRDFADEENIKAIDPIVFAWTPYGRNNRDINSIGALLIPLTWWV